MVTFLPVLPVIFSATVLFPLHHFLRKKRIFIPWIFYYLFWLLPFLAGGFHTYTAPISFLALTLALIHLLHKRKTLRFFANWNAVAIGLVVLGYCITPLWAADRGMAVLGITRFLPLLLLTIVLMQHSADEKTQALVLLPICGAVMTVLSVILFLFPSCRDLVTVNGRLSGFFQYPNTYASFLLISIVVLGTGAYTFKGRLIIGLLLLAGMFFSGSRTGLFLLLMVLPGIAVVREKLQPVYAWLIFLSGCIITAAAIVLGRNLIGRDVGSVFVRLIYYMDAIPVILKHPFGIGYMGYRAMEATFQTSRYTVTFVHSSFLQLLLDIGWVPALLFAVCICSSLFSKKLSGGYKLTILTLILHSLLEFNLQFFLFWAILLLLMDYDSSFVYETHHTGWTAALLIPTFLLCLWLGAGDFLYQTGHIEAALQLTPFHTDALAYQLTRLSDTEELDRLSDQILTLNPTHSLAWNAKANAALARGEVKNMIQYKEKAIAFAPYEIETYCDYLDKLYALLVHYTQAGDPGSASICRKKVLEIPYRLERVSSGTHPLAYLTGVDMQITLPDSYQTWISEIQAIEGIP